LETKYASEIVVPLTGETLKSFTDELILSAIITVLEQNATVTALTLKIEDISHAPATPFNIRGSMDMPYSENILSKLSIYTVLKNVTNNIKSIMGVNNDIKKVNMSLK
jgi:hypothetical protein